MASPTRTWTSLLLALAMLYFLYYNVLQLVDVGRALDMPISTKMLTISGAVDTDRILGMGGAGVLIGIYVLACLCIFLPKHDKHRMVKSQLRCFIMIGICLLLAFTTSAMSYVEMAIKGNPETILIAEVALASTRLLLLGGIIGCAAHVLKHT